MIDLHRQTFRDEAYELLAELETSLLELYENSSDPELVARIFRAMHTIKGSGAMFGYDDISIFTHDVETVYDLVRTGQLVATPELVTLSLAARDQIKEMLDAADGIGRVNEEHKAEIIAGFRALLTPSDSPVRERAPLVGESAANAVTYRIRFKPLPRLFQTGANPLVLINELSEMGRMFVIAQTSNLPLLSELDPELCYLFWDIVITTDKGENALRDIFIFVEDDCELTIDVIDDGGNLDNDEDYEQLGAILIKRGDLDQEETNLILSRHKRFGELAVEAGLIESKQVASALAEQQYVKGLRKERQTQESGSSIRVPAEKLDILVNLVGEMVTVQARLSQYAQSSNEAALVAIAEEVERLTASLRDNALNIRMLPIGTTFTKFRRLVHDLSQELGKRIEMVTTGAETELDKTVIEKLNDPLVHLIRNCIDHGIEMPEVRAAKGKPRTGTIHLSAIHSGDSVLITIMDDGAGLNREAIRAKAVEKGLVAAGAELSAKEIYGLIFSPGFSTAQQVTNLSGRGVGMDVVRRAIDSLRGTIDVDSREGEGSTITLRIPLTLAIIESLLVRIGEDCFVLPLSFVDECIELSREDVARSHGRHVMNVRGKYVPYIPLRERFSIGGEVPAIEQIVITQIGGNRVGFVVDHVIGEHQTVIKSLSRIYRNVEGVSGATILGDGSVALILDIPQLYKGAELAEREAC